MIWFTIFTNHWWLAQDYYFYVPIQACIVYGCGSFVCHDDCMVIGNFQVDIFDVYVNLLVICVDGA